MGKGLWNAPTKVESFALATLSTKRKTSKVKKSLKRKKKEKGKKVPRWSIMLKKGMLRLVSERSSTKVGVRHMKKKQKM
jgi:hypothetical protein